MQTTLAHGSGCWTCGSRPCGLSTTLELKARTKEYRPRRRSHDRPELEHCITATLTERTEAVEHLGTGRRTTAYRSPMIMRTLRRADLVARHQRWRALTVAGGRPTSSAMDTRGRSERDCREVQRPQQMRSRSGTATGRIVATGSGRFRPDPLSPEAMTRTERHSTRERQPSCLMQHCCGRSWPEQDASTPPRRAIAVQPRRSPESPNAPQLRVRSGELRSFRTTYVSTGAGDDQLTRRAMHAL